MVFWIAVAMLAAGVTYAVTRPLLQPAETPADAALADRAVYKDQLTEIDADAARGTISLSEAEAARAEVARRVLRQSDRASGASVSAVWTRLVKPIYLAATLALPLVSLALYMTFGAPGLPGLPLKDRIAAPIDSNKPEELIAKVEARLRDHPEDGKGWDVIAPVYMAQSRFADAASAYASAMKFLGENPARLQGFANARIRTENGMVPDDARKALLSLLASNPNLKEPRVWLALAKEQDGKSQEAASDYRALIAEAPENAPWRPVLQERLARLEGQGPVAPAAGNMSPEKQQAFITQMVDGLAGRLKANGRDKDGWLKLIRAYQALGRTDDAIKAVASAKSGLAGDDGALRDIDALVSELGIGG